MVLFDSSSGNISPVTSQPLGITSPESMRSESQVLTNPGSTRSTRRQRTTSDTSKISTPAKKQRKELPVTELTASGTVQSQEQSPKEDDKDEVLSESPLSEPPTESQSEFESPFFSNPGSPIKRPEVRAVKLRRPTKSPYFPKQLAPRIVCLPFPPLSANKFGLVQEKIANDPFRVLIATIFLNRTRGEQAIPVYFQLMERYPTIESLAQAKLEDISQMIHRLGFQNQRAKRCIEIAKTWLSNPPAQGKRYRKVDYPSKGCGRDIQSQDILPDDDPRSAWEIAHLQGIGAYAIDSWRIFCRDKLRGLADGWNGECSSDPDFEPEWRRVLPTDKELRAYLAWMWLKVGYTWNITTGETQKASLELLQAAKNGGVVHEEGDYLVLTSTAKHVDSTSSSPGKKASAMIKSLTEDIAINDGPDEHGFERGTK